MGQVAEARHAANEMNDATTTSSLQMPEPAWETLRPADPAAAPRPHGFLYGLRQRLHLVDAAALALAAFATVAVSDVSPGLAAAFVVASMAVLGYRGAYVPRLNGSLLDELGRVLPGIALAAMGLLAAGELTQASADASASVVPLWVVGTAFFVAARTLMAVAARRSFRTGTGGVPTLIVGAGDVGRRLATRLEQRPELGLRPIGFLDARPKNQERTESKTLPVLGGSWDLEDVVARHGVGRLVITFSTAPHHVLLDIISRANRLGVEVSIVPRLFESLSSRLTIEHVGGIVLLQSDGVDPKGVQFAMKYALDRVIAAVALVLIAPLLFIIALAVKLDSPGPILFRQQRVGLDGRVFTLLKFRSMHGSPETDSEADQAWLESAAAGGTQAPAAKQGTPATNRETRVGSLLRKSSLDELPQLLNILRGELSFVGPRPERVTAVRMVAPHVHRYGDRQRVKSGLTGWAQVHGLRGETSLHDRVEWDNAYIENWSVWLEIKTLILTVPAVLRGLRA